MNKNILLISFLFLPFTFLLAQNIKTEDVKELKQNSIKIPNSPAAIGDKVIVKDESGNALIEVNDEGTFGSITLPDSTAAPATITNRLYNVNGTLNFNGVPLGSGSGVDSINHLLDAKTGITSLFLGAGAGRVDNGTDNKNTGVGIEALYNNGQGYRNTALGAYSLYSNRKADYNTACGYMSLYSNSGDDAKGNTALGDYSLFSNTTGYHNVGLGTGANHYNQTGSKNTIIGFEAGKGTIEHYKSGNVFLGYKAGYFETESNKLYIQNDSSETPLIGGDFESDEVYLNGKVGIGTASPNTDLDIRGSNPDDNAGMQVANSDESHWLYFASGKQSNLNSSIMWNEGDALRFGSASTSFNERMRIDHNGYVGIGTSTPSEMLEVADTIHSTVGGFKFPDGSVQATAATGGGVSEIDDLIDAQYDESSLYLGNGAGGTSDDGANYNVAIGKDALNSNTSGLNNTANGYRALYSNTEGNSNIANGYYALYSNQTGYSNTANGSNALYSNIHGFGNTANGNHALFLNTGNYNTANGSNALNHNSIGYLNTANGSYALFSNKAGNGGVAIGYESQRNANNTELAFTNYNTSVGYQSLKGSATASNNTGNSNSAFGYQSLTSNTTGSYNTAYGTYSLFSNTIGNRNTANGFRALSSNTTGSYNTANGRDALYTNKAGNSGVAIGYESQRYANNTETAFTNFNTSVGYQSLRGSTTASNNTGNSNSAFGYQALFSNKEGIGNTANGYGALFSNTDGDYNFASGHQALYSNTTGNGNIGIGFRTNYHNKTGSTNTIVGYQAGYGSLNQNKSGNVFLGYYAGYSENGSNKLYIENSNSSQPLIWGDFANNRVVINGNSGSGNPGFEFFVNGDAGGNNPWNNLSDKRLKKNIKSISNALDKVKKLHGVNYEWKNNENRSEGTQMGFIAQEANEVIPEVVDDDGKYFSMQYAPITALLVEAVKEQETSIKNQDARIKRLEEENRKILQELIELKKELGSEKFSKIGN